jgi:putative membrane protein
MKTTFRAILALCMLSFSTLADAGKLPAGFTVGYNEAWIENNYGNWLTSNPLFGIPSAFPSPFTCCANNSTLSAMLLGMGQGNAKVVRLFLFPAVQGIRINTSVTSSTSTAVTMTQGLTTDFLTNLESIFQWIRQYNVNNNTNLKLYITALNGADMNVVTASNNPTLHSYYQRLLSNSAEITAYDTLVLEPIIQLMSRYQDVVFAFDLINEIEGAINAGYISWSGARTWISNAAYSINVLFPWLPVTSTAGYGYAVQEVTYGFFTGLHLNFYDVHIYSDKGTYSGQTALCSKVASDKLAIILGEFGQYSSTASDSIQNTATTNFLKGAGSSCFSGALAWKYESTSGEPWYSYLYVNLPVPSTGGTLSAPPCSAQQLGLPASVQVPGPACARPAYATIQNFALGASQLVSAAKPGVGITGVTSAAALDATSLTDPQVAQVAHVAAQIDIANAKLALDKSLNGWVRAFAAATLNDYAAADAGALSSLSSANINLQDNALGESLLGAASEQAQQLSQLSGAAFDEAYARNELAFHVFISGAIEITLIPSAQSPQVKNLLQSELGLYQKHLQGAGELVGQLQTPTYLPLPPPKRR